MLFVLQIALITISYLTLNVKIQELIENGSVQYLEASRKFKSEK